MLSHYEFKYVCGKCGTIHYYLPEGGCRHPGCGTKTLEKLRNRGESMARKREPKPEEPVETLDNVPNFEIDEYQLEKEWKQHPTDYYYWATKAADAQNHYDTKKHELEVKRASLDGMIRKDPGDYGLSKVTETVISSTITTQPDYKSAHNRVLEAKHELDKAKAVIDSLEHKKRAMSMLTELWIRSYYSDPNFKGSSEEAQEFDKTMQRERRHRKTEED